MLGRDEAIIFTSLLIKDLESQTNRIIPNDVIYIIFRYTDSSARQLIRGNTFSAKLFLLDATEYLFNDMDTVQKNGAMFILNRYINILTSEYQKRSMAA